MSRFKGVIGRILSFQRGGGGVYPNRALIWIPQVNSYKEAAKFLNRKVIWKGKNKVIYGKIRRLHGRKGVLLAYFRKPLPGQALGTEVQIL
ncbi:MAG: 50S ribosomal protein L35ae [Thermoprotei archaeon]|nr:MAG: 50S ribosomal protein L35ae [Thermoprotei archaeon]RLF20214.1 MAG: 50S ribosomal protein L35ae [Thermoprotei archaeon]